MVAPRNLKYANSSLNYYVIMMVRNLKKKLNRKFPIFSHSEVRSAELEHPSKRSALVRDINFAY